MSPWRGLWSFFLGLAGAVTVTTTNRIFGPAPSGTPHLFGSAPEGTARIFETPVETGGAGRIFKS
jgi:hypothetical protein